MADRTCGDNGGTIASGAPCSRAVDGDGLCWQHDGRQHNAGRPGHEPTEEQRRFVLTCAQGGIPQEEIARVLEIDAKTLRKHYREEIDYGATKANARVVAEAFRQATSGESPAMTMFWLKTRMGWKETQRLEQSIEDNTVDRVEVVVHGPRDGRRTGNHDNSDADE